MKPDDGSYVLMVLIANGDDENLNVYIAGNVLWLGGAGGPPPVGGEEFAWDGDWYKFVNGTRTIRIHQDTRTWTYYDSATGMVKMGKY